MTPTDIDAPGNACTTDIMASVCSMLTYTPPATNSFYDHNSRKTRVSGYDIFQENQSLYISTPSLSLFILSIYTKPQLCPFVKHASFCHVAGVEYAGLENTAPNCRIF